MLKHVGDQAERFSGGLVGATLGVIFSLSSSAMHISGATAFLIPFFLLFCIQSLPRYFANRPNGAGRALLTFLVFIILWAVATVYFSNLYVFREGWSVKDIDTRVLLAHFTLFVAGAVSVASTTMENLE